MSRFSPLTLGFAVPLSLISQAALADLTPAQVWGDWQSYMQGMGYQISATETASGGNLTVSDINMQFAMPDSGNMTMSMGTIRFDQNSDGTVAIVLPDVMPITMAGSNLPDGGDFSMLMNYAQTGHSLTASGTPEATTYDYDAATIALTLDQITAEGGNVSPDNVAMNFSATNLNSTTQMTIGATRGYAQSGTVDSVAYALKVDDPENPGSNGDVTGSITGVSFDGTGTIPLQIPDASDMAAMLAAGFDITGSFAYEGGSSSFDIKNPEDGNFVMNTSSQGGSLGVEMGADGLVYTGSQRNLSMGVTLEVMPFPFQIDMAEGGFNLAMPVSKSDDPQDFALGINMSQFTMSDMIWSAFDPAGQLPRDPATVLLDLTGKAKLLVDWLNPEAAAQMTGAPGEVQAVALNNLLVTAAGAKLEGNGDITFDGAGPAMIPGMGNPVGAVNLALAGGNGLLDKLVAMGLIPQDQAMGARMMMGLFAVPGNAPDTLTSKIEFTPEGQILANGQRIR
ncbi:MAG: hypothetical protein AB8B60_00130 [Sulfitobacter sp.]